jgi:hypothetical protein
MWWRVRNPWSLADRSWRQAADWVWHDVKVGLIACLGIILLIAVVWGGEWRHVVIATVVVWLVLPVVAFLVNFVRNVMQPARHGRWRSRMEMGESADGPLLVLALTCTDAHHSTELACVVTDPSGGNWRRPCGAGSMMVGSTPSCAYPMNFDGAPPLASGEYVVAWQEREKDAWHEMLRDHHVVELG